MNDELCRQWIDYLPSLPPNEQSKTIASFPPEAQGKILASLSSSDQSRFLTALPPTEYMKYHKLIQQYQPQVIQPPPPPPPITSSAQESNQTPIAHAVPLGHNEPVGHNGEYRIYRGRLDGYKVKRKRRISPIIWVCEVIQVQHNPSVVNFNKVMPGVEVLVHTNEIYDLTDEDYADIAAYHASSQIQNEIQNLRIGSWNIRCTGDFQRKYVFFPELLERFERLADFIHRSECDIVALQEFPLNFEHGQSKVPIEACHLDRKSVV